MSNMINVEVAYALPHEQIIIALKVGLDTTVEQAIRQSGVLERFAEIDLEKNKVGVFGKLTKLDNTVREGDRIEIYRPLLADPKEVRKRRAAEGKGPKRRQEESQGSSD